MYLNIMYFQVIMIFTWSDVKRSSYADYVFPIWADLLGWFMSMLSLLPMPIVAIHQVYKAGPQAGSIRQVG
jgi:solute carrier family 6 amino acid transporter-like protein 5/7/9/14